MKSILHFILTIAFITTCNGQTNLLQRLKHIPQGAAESVVLTQYEGVSVADTGNAFIRADRICAYGIWALYSTKNFGVGQETTTTVISIVGKNPTKLECSNPGQIAGLRQVQSVRFLGNRFTNGSGIAILSDAYLLGGKWETFAPSSINTDSTDITAVRMGSIAITGTQPWITCSDPESKYCMCVDPLNSRFSGFGGGIFLNRDTVRDTSSKWRLTVKSVDNIGRADCAIMSNPSYLQNTAFFSSG